MIGLLLYGVSLYALNTYLWLSLSNWFCMSFYYNSVELSDKSKLQEFGKPGKTEEERGGDSLEGDGSPQEAEKRGRVIKGNHDLSVGLCWLCSVLSKAEES